MIGVSTPEYQLSVGNGGEFVESLEAAVLTSGRIVEVYVRGGLGGVVQIFNPTTGLVEKSTLIFASSANPGLWGFKGLDVVAQSGGGFVVFGNGVTLLNAPMPAIWRFDAAGNQVGDPVMVLGTTAENVTLHTTANGFMLTYADRSSGTYKAYAQTYDAAGSAIGAPQLVGLLIDKDIDVVRLANGRMALIWDSLAGVKLAEMTANGVLTGVTATVDTSTNSPFGWAMGAKVVAEGRGFLTLHMEGTGLVMTRFDSSFVQVGVPMPVLGPQPATGDFGGYLKTNQNEPTHDIAVLPNGVIVVAWSGYDPGSFRDANIYLQYFAPNGTALTDPIIANARLPEDQRSVTLLRMPDGRIFLSFIDDTNVPFGGSQASARGVFLDGPDSYYVGTAGANTRNGGAGDDAMLGQGGRDTLNGLGGDDQVSGNEADDSLLGGSGQDQVNGGSGNDRMFGEAGADVLQGGEGADFASGGDGNDTLSGQDGADSLLGDAGMDVIYGGAGNDTASGGTGADLVEGGDGNDRLLGSLGNDTLNGNDGNDFADGGAGNDQLDGGAGNDRLLGQVGDDRLYGGSERDTVIGGAGNDIVNGGDGDDNLDGGAGFDIMAGQRGNDRLAGGAGDDDIRGGQDNDTMSGGDGNDSLISASGDDIIGGGLGADLFDFSFTFSEGAIGHDIIVDYAPGLDRIDLSGWGLEFGTTLTLVSRPNGSSALVTASGDEVLLRGVLVSAFVETDLAL